MSEVCVICGYPASYRRISIHTETDSHRCSTHLLDKQDFHAQPHKEETT